MAYIPLTNTPSGGVPSVTPALVRSSLPPSDRITAITDEYLNTLLAQAERRLIMELRRRGGCSWDDLMADPVASAFIADLVVGAASRVVRNPSAADGYKSENEDSYGYTVANAMEASASIWYPDKELELLCPASVAGAWGSIKLVAPRRDW